MQCKHCFGLLGSDPEQIELGLCEVCIKLKEGKHENSVDNSDLPCTC